MKTRRRQESAFVRTNCGGVKKVCRSTAKDGDLPDVRGDDATFTDQQQEAQATHTRHGLAMQRLTTHY